MKTAKKLSSLLLAMIMLVALAVVPAAADDSDAPTTGTITISTGDKDTSEHTFTAYQIFTGTVNENGYLGGAAWADGVNGAQLLNVLKAATGTLANKFDSCTGPADVAAVMSTIASNSDDAKALAELLSDAVKSNYIPASGTFTKSEEGGTYTLDNLPTGYYLITDSSETAYTSHPILTMVKAGANPVTVKSDNLPTVTKDVNDAGNKISYGIGDEIPYIVTYSTRDYNAEDTAYSFTMTDTMSDCLELVGGTDGVKVMIGDTAVTGLTITYANNVLTIEGDIQTQIDENSVVTVTYSAKIKDNYTANSVVTNTVEVNGVPTPAVKNVYPLNLEIDKVDGNTQAALANVGFKLSRTTDDGKTEYLKVDADSKVFYWTEDKNDASELTTGDDGKVTVYGLKVGTYSLEETTPPDQYNALESAITLVITASENPAKTALESVTVAVNEVEKTSLGDTAVAVVENFQGTTLPSTGGMGTTIFYVVGAILAVGAIVLLVTRKRMNDEK